MAQVTTNSNQQRRPFFVKKTTTQVNENVIEVGEQVVTSHVSSRFLQGLFIGYISEISIDSNNLTRSGYITPAVDFRNLQEVLVITSTKQELINDILRKHHSEGKMILPKLLICQLFKY